MSPVFFVVFIINLCLGWAKACCEILASDWHKGLQRIRSHYFMRQPIRRELSPSFRTPQPQSFAHPRCWRLMTKLWLKFLTFFQALRAEILRNILIAKELESEKQNAAEKTDDSKLLDLPAENDQPQTTSKGNTPSGKKNKKRKHKLQKPKHQKWWLF